jgi:hypothetical protein
MGPIGPQGPGGPSGSYLWNSGIAVFNSVLTAAIFTPDTNITATRIQVQLVSGPSGCSVNAVLQLTDGTPAGTKNLTLSAATSDTGSFAINYAAGTQLRIGVLTPANCSRPPLAANIAVQYKAR